MIGVTFAGVITIIFAVIYVIFWLSWRSRIPFATACLETVSQLIQDYPTTVYVAYCSLVLQIVWVGFWLYLVSLCQQYFSGGGYALLVFLIFSFFWVTQVIKNTVHVTASGTFATWYFMSGVAMPMNPTLSSFKRAITTSFGSICFGSLIIALLQTLRTLIRSLRNERTWWLVCIADCILGIIDNLMQYFNIYAFAQVAIYGKTYWQAAKDTWGLFHSHGIQAIINDNLVSNVLTMGALLIGVFCAIIGFGLSAVTSANYGAGCAVLGFLFGFTIAIVTMEVVESGTCTLFVCFAMDPATLMRTKPMLYNILTTTYNFMW